ncbi:MAG: ParB family chromosome partitioning protein [Myxococcota bacterium]|jgi:ParB family chromosome partitioning protein
MSRVGRGLGRGFASLIPEGALDALPSADGGRLRTVPLDEIQPNPEQPREVFDAEDLRSLAESIRTHGVLSPLVVRRHEGHYVLIAGERRLRASALAGLADVPVVVYDGAESGSAQLEVALVENLQRSDLDPIEAARGFERLMVEYGHTQEKVAERVGKNRATIANAVRLLKLPEFVLGSIRDGRISAGHARALLPLTDVDELRAVLARVIAQRLSVRATESLVQRKVKVGPVQAVERRARERTLDYATRLLEESLRTSVRIQTRSKGDGRIVIDFADAEDLERLITRLRADAAE